MTNEEILIKLKEYHQEELADYNKYCEMASALDGNHPKLAGIFRDISKEEKTHASLMEYMIGKID